MALYKLIAPAYINDRFYSKEDIESAGATGLIVDYSGKVRPEDMHLQLVEGAANEKAAASDAKAQDDADRAAAIAAKLRDDDNNMIGKDTPMEVVIRKLAEFKQSNAFN